MDVVSHLADGSAPESPRKKAGQYRLAAGMERLDELREAMTCTEAFVSQAAILIADQTRRMDEIKQWLQAAGAARNADRAEKNGGGHLIAGIEGLEELKEAVTCAEAFVSQAGTLLAGQTGRIDEIKQALEVTVQALETELREKARLMRRKESVVKGLEEILNARIHDLEDQLREKEERLDSASEEIAKLEKTNDRFQAQLRQAETPHPVKGSRFEELEELLTARIRDLEDRLDLLYQSLETKMPDGSGWNPETTPPGASE